MARNKTTKGVKKRNNIVRQYRDFAPFIIYTHTTHTHIGYTKVDKTVENCNYISKGGEIFRRRILHVSQGIFATRETGSATLTLMGIIFSLSLSRKWQKWHLWLLCSIQNGGLGYFNFRGLKKKKKKKKKKSQENEGSFIHDETQDVDLHENITCTSVMQAVIQKPLLSSFA